MGARVAAKTAAAPPPPASAATAAKDNDIGHNNSNNNNGGTSPEASTGVASAAATSRHTVVRHPPAPGWNYPPVPEGCEAKFAVIRLGNTQHKVRCGIGLILFYFLWASYYGSYKYIMLGHVFGMQS